MQITVAAAVAWLALAGPGRAMAQHHHETPPAGADHVFTGGLSLFAASYSNELYGGAYQGVAPSLRWSSGRFGAAAAIALYHLDGNGRSLYGPGDAVAQGSAILVEGGHLRAGLAFAVSVPTGDNLTGFGMGHLMVMPSLWATHTLGAVTYAVTGGAGRAIGDNTTGHKHGVWPLVDPMNLAEVTWSISGDVALARELSVGARAVGAMPIGEGTTRVATGLRATWTAGRVATGFEIQAGLAGDPFRFRGVVGSAVRF
jgi:hypothetical protein